MSDSPPAVSLQEQIAGVRALLSMALPLQAVLHTLLDLDTAELEALRIQNVSYRQVNAELEEELRQYEEENAELRAELLNYKESTE